LENKQELLQESLIKFDDSVPIIISLAFPVMFFDVFHFNFRHHRKCRMRKRATAYASTYAACE
jgi:hypothetical protein